VTKDEIIADLTAQRELLKTKQELCDVLIEKLRSAELEESEDMLKMLLPTGDFEQLVRCGLHFLNLTGWVN